ncbi:MAG: S53 family peptidase [Actinomycetota bacterium]|nr:S53 family peptidase [Actinomycetota bacterium]
MARCHAIRLDNPKKVARSGGTATANPSAGSGPSGGFAPSDLQTAYNLTSSSSANGAGQTIAIVDAYDDPNAESDLGVYRSKFGLPACTTANGCFKKVNQSGSTTGPWPRGDGGWAQEISLDLDMASAICPNCKILLVEANSNSYANLGAAVNTAASLGASVISNSYGGGEFLSETSYESPYNHPGIAVTVSSGDSGYGVEFPASSRYVTAVGGTSLYVDSSFNRSSEAVWSGAGSGCSAYIPKPSWQTDIGCSRRTVADVAAVASPNTGVSVYDTYKDAYGSGSGWMVFGGTSVASPIVASVYALSGNVSSLNYGSYSYGHTGSLFDVTSGSNGTCTGGGGRKRQRSTAFAYLCTGVSGYDGPTGNGTPKGTDGF